MCVIGRTLQTAELDCSGEARKLEQILGLPSWSHSTGSSVYLDDGVDSQNHFGPLHRVDRALLQAPLLLVQQTVEHRGDLRHLKVQRRQQSHSQLYCQRCNMYRTYRGLKLGLHNISFVYGHRNINLCNKHIATDYNIAL